MSNPIRKATFRANIEDVIFDIFVRTSSDNVVIDKEGTLLSDYLVNVVLQDDLTQAIQNLKSDILDGAPEAYDTLKEIADYIKEHGDLTEAIREILNLKADKSEVDRIANSLQTLSDSVDSLPKIFYSVERPSNLKLGDMWVQPVSGAEVLAELRQ